MSLGSGLAFLMDNKGWSYKTMVLVETTLVPDDGCSTTTSDGEDWINSSFEDDCALVLVETLTSHV